MDIFLDGGELDFEDQDILDDQYISDFNDDKVASVPITDDKDLAIGVGSTKTASQKTKQA